MIYPHPGYPPVELFAGIIHNESPGSDIISAAFAYLDDDGRKIGGGTFFVGESLLCLNFSTSDCGWVGRMRSETTAYHLPPNPRHPMWLRATQGGGIFEGGEMLESWPAKREAAQ